MADFYSTAKHYWDFEQKPISTIKDKISRKIIVTNGNNVEQRESLHGQSIAFSSSENSWIKLKPFFGTSNCLYNPKGCTTGLTVAMWLKFDHSNDKQRIFGNAQTNFVQGISMYILPRSSRLSITVNNTKQSCYYTYNLYRKTWMHVAFKWNPQEFKLNFYLDGSFVWPMWEKWWTNCNDTKYLLPKKTLSKSGVYYVGGHLYGEIDDLAIWNNDLSVQEIIKPWNFAKGKD